MEDLNCPKCGSNQISNGECLKCGLILSRYSAMQQNRPDRSFPVAPPVATPHNFHRGPSIEETAEAYHANLRKSKKQTQIITMVVVAILGLGLYMGYSAFKRKSAEYGGEYRNGTVLFSMRFPEKGWNHYHDDEVGTLELRDFTLNEVKDGFYQGDADDPQLLMVVWNYASDYMSGRFVSPNESLRFRKKTMEELQKKLSSSGIESEIKFREERGVGESIGFVFDVQLKKGDVVYNAPVYAGYNHSLHYLVMFVGKDDQVAKDTSAELMKTFSFKTSAI